MSDIFIIHGTGSDPNQNWLPWLKEQLEAEGHTVFVPEFPTPEDQSLDSWMDVIGNYMKHIHEDTVFVGHSLGPAFILSLLERLDVQVKLCVYVAGFTGNIGITEFDELNDSFVNKEFDWEKIRQASKGFLVINSDDDPYVPLQNGKDLAANLGVELDVMHGAGHINAESGFVMFEKLLGLLKEKL